ncbi:lysine-specific demethylase 8 [Trichoderma arundinaceum]|uniref:Lysine-specific demethylase 8 n=1 Tax=Trichoderma arundinaceum TaxID=490622 RepID=A0A395NHC2_TRIAR|nr:lysine-specific demethylase 8 [Trichoderma arundinaceum]
MSSLRDQVLSRYRDAANIIATSQHASSDATNVKPDATQALPLSADTDLRGYAMQQLLQRQAWLLVKLHEAVEHKTDAGDLVGVDEDLLQTRLDDLASVSMSAFYAYRFDLLPYYWRWIYTDTLILVSHYSILQAVRRDSLDELVMDRVVETLDRALIVAGGAGIFLGKQWIEKTLDLLGHFWQEEEAAKAEAQRPHKRIKRDSAFSTCEPFGRPNLSADKTCPRHENWTLEKFEKYMNEESRGRPLPVVFTDLTKEWPAFSDRPWNSPEHLLSRTFGGRRLVPIEIGRSYVDEGWSQELVQFKHFLAKYIDPSILPCDDDDASPPPQDSQQPEKVGYLAQHNLFQQIPALRNDIQVPDFCWADVPPHPTDPSKDQAPVDVPQLNAWFGPARTITPLHTDGYHNLLCQVVGTKYVRLYSPEETARLRPRGMEHGVDMSNTSELDVGILEGWDEDQDADNDGNEVNDWDGIRKELKDVPYWECILQPGDTLVIPMGWWHYVRSLSISFSVSFWWN